MKEEFYTLLLDMYCCWIVQRGYHGTAKYEYGKFRTYREALDAANSMNNLSPSKSERSLCPWVSYRRPGLHTAKKQEL